MIWRYREGEIPRTGLSFLWQKGPSVYWLLPFWWRWYLTGRVRFRVQRAGRRVTLFWRLVLLQEAPEPCPCGGTLVSRTAFARSGQIPPWSVTQIVFHPWCALCGAGELARPWPVDGVKA